MKYRFQEDRYFEAEARHYSRQNCAAFVSARIVDISGDLKSMGHSYQTWLTEYVTWDHLQIYAFLSLIWSMPAHAKIKEKIEDLEH